VVVLSVTEGEDKPLKYPVMFKAADLVVITKCDLLPHLDVDLGRIHDALSRVMPSPRAIETSARTGQGMDKWIAWLEEQRAPFADLPVHDHTHEHLDSGHVHAHAPGEPGHRHGS
jgi:hydrogenase nickel incorporation protein HypB